MYMYLKYLDFIYKEDNLYAQNYNLIGIETTSRFTDFRGFFLWLKIPSPFTLQ